MILAAAVRRASVIPIAVIASGTASAQPTAGAARNYAAKPDREMAELMRCERRRPSEGDDILVCGRRNGEVSPYRLPIRPEGFDPGGTTDSVSRERNRLIQEGADLAGGTCSTVGSGGFGGCFFRDVKRRREQYGK